MSDYATHSGQGQKFEGHMYYRRPRTGEQNGWIVVQGNNLDRQQSLQMRGFEPMFKYGTIQNAERLRRQSGQLSKDEQINQWAAILEHPDGPAEFPVDQILTLRWYQPEHCPVSPLPKFPQLGGQSVIQYQCPECQHLPFQSVNGAGTGIEALGRHLRIVHSWDRASLVKYGEKANLDFDAIYSSVKHEYNFDGSEKPQKKSGFGCDECSWTPKAGAKRPAMALTLHRKEHEFTLETVE